MENVTAYPITPADLTRKLLCWYDRGHRDLPWRPAIGQLGDPYHVWLSEVMLQQTTVAAVIPYFRKFLALWPSLSDLAAAHSDDVMAAWAGLGYYSRARNLLKCAQQVIDERSGHFPQTEAEIRKLAGCGPYTAAAIAAIAFGQPVAAVDGNVERCLSRLMDDATLLPQFKRKAQTIAQGLVPEERPGDFVQASIELGAVICRPKDPKCEICPWGEFCLARKSGSIADRPKRPPKQIKPRRYGIAYWLEQEGQSGKVWLIRRPSKGLLGGMIAFPCSEWIEQDALTLPNFQQDLPDAHVTVFNRSVKHVFTHFALEMTVAKVVLPEKVDVTAAFGVGQWQEADSLFEVGLPTVMTKVAKIILGELA